MYPNRMYKILNALYRLKQAPQTWYGRLKTFLLDHGYVMGSVDKTLFTLKHGNDFLLVQIYVDDIIFGGSSHSFVSSLAHDGTLKRCVPLVLKVHSHLSCS
jgi:hypothetical protein